MHAKAFFALLAACYLSAVAHANPTIFLPNWQINQAAGQSIDLNTGQPIGVMIETPGGPPEEIFAGMELALDSPGPLIQAIDINGAGTVFAGNNTGLFLHTGGGLGPLPAHRAWATTVTVSGTVLAGDGAGGPVALAHLTFDASGVPLGTYPVYLRTPYGSVTIATDVVDLGGSLGPTLLDGSVTMRPALANDGVVMYGMMTVVPEPGSLALAVLAACGAWIAALDRRRRLREKH